MANVIDKVAGLVVGPQGPQGPQGPKGDTGQTGPQGATGATGATPNLTMGTVTTLEPDSPATATITGTTENPVLNLGLPKGRTGEVSQAEFDEVAEDVSQLKSEFNSKPSYNDVGNISNGGYLSVGLMPGATSFNWSSSTALSPDAPITNAYKLAYITLLVATSGTFNVGLYTISGTTATITHLKTVTANETGLVTFDIDWDLDSTKTYYMFVFIGTGVFKFYSNTIQSKYYSFSSADVSVGSSITLSQTGNGLSFINGMVICAVDTSNRGYLTVAKSGGQYKTIQEAVNNAKAGDTIIVFPGVYEEYITRANQYTSNSGIHIIGVDRNSCIIKWGSGKYNESTIRLYADSTLENLTIIATAENAGSWYPTWQYGQSDTYGSYAVHWDGSTDEWNGTIGVIRNCKIYSECSHAVGAGAQKGYTVLIENCEIVRNVLDSHYVSSNYDGAMGCHSPNSNVNDNGSKLIMRDCTVINQTLEKALQLFNVSATSPFSAEIKGCTFKDVNGIDNVIKFWNCTNSMITNMSHGNSTDECNYRSIHA